METVPAPVTTLLTSPAPPPLPSPAPLARAAPPPAPLPVHPPTGGRAEPGATVRLLRPRAALPSSRRYDDFRTTQLFVPLAAQLAADGFRVRPEAGAERELSKLTYRLVLFAELTLGRDVPPHARPQQATKLPWRFFTDYSPTGPLRTILATCLRFRDARGWTTLDPRDATRMHDHLELYKAIERALKDDRFYAPFKVHLAPSVPEQVAAELRVLIQSHGGAVVSTPDVASHVVYPDPPGTCEHEVDAQVLVRYLKRESRHGGVRYFVHWWYHPDCYDDWVIAREVGGQLDPTPPDRVGPWHVQARWIRDLDRFNEWMNERDYEMPSTFKGYVGYVPPQMDMHLAPQVRLRLRMPDKEEREPAAKRMRADAQGFQLVGLPSIPRAVDSHSGKPADMDPNSAMLPGVPDTAAVLGPGELSGRGNLSDSAGHDVLQLHDEVRVPEFSAWFDVDGIHDIERLALPEFFSGSFRSKTDQTYVEIRNFMILTWRRMPSRYLSATAARRQLRGDACSILRVHEFLEHWGLINFEVDPETMPQPSFVPPPLVLPTQAGRVDPASALRHSLLFLGDGSAVEIDEHYIRRIKLNGTQISSHPGPRAASGTMAQILAVMARNGGDNTATTPVANHRHSMLTPEEFLGANERSMSEPLPQDSNRRPSGRNVRPERSARSTRSVYGRYGRRARTSSRYIDDSSDDEKQDDDDQDGEDENDEVVDDSATEPDGGAEMNDESKGDKTSRTDDIEYHCDICGKDCTRVRYHCATQADLDLCETCFTDRKYPPTMLPRDFIQMTSSPIGNGADGKTRHDSRVWSESETLLLLEALEMYGDSWNMIAEHVASKDQEQCVLQFLRLPIEDTFLHDLQEKWWSSKFSDSQAPSMPPAELMLKSGAKESAIAMLSRKSDAQKSLTGLPLVFSDRINTVTPQAALLAGQVPSDIIDVLMSDVSVDCPTVESTAKDALQRVVLKCRAGSGVAKADDTERSDTAVAGGDTPGSSANSTSNEKLNNGNISGCDGSAHSTEECVTDVLYRRMLADAPYAHAIAGSEFGLRAAQGALEFLHGDSGEDEPVERVPEKSRDGHRGAPTKSGAERTSRSTDARAKVADESSRCVAAVALASAAGRAAKLADMESLELARLYSMIYEVKLDMIRMKMRHLQAIHAHRDKSRAYRTRESLRKFGEDYVITRLHRDVGPELAVVGDEKLCFRTIQPGVDKETSSADQPAPAIRTNANFERVAPSPNSLNIRPN
jgi:SWIRM-associated domain at the N-terminal/SWIRM domain/Myb-like DNA-binding domain/Zinc finger, ZZ type